jgi:hypothetical protein
MPIDLMGLAFVVLSVCMIEVKVLYDAYKEQS